MLLVDYGTEQALAITMYTSAGLAITGLEAGDITCYYKRYGDTSWTTKVLSAANWSEDSGGLYSITFTASELGVYGNFVYFVRYGSEYGAATVLVTDYSSEADTLQDIYDLMSLKVNKSDILIRERDLDNVVKALGKSYTQSNTDLIQVYNELTALKSRIAAL